jgi:hypothetical protein
MSAKKNNLLGMSYGTAANRMRKLLMFNLVCRLNENFCHRCGGEIETASAFSIEHTVPWESAVDPVAAFFDLEKIKFSHLRCNSGARISSMRVYASKDDARAAHTMLTRSLYDPSVRHERYLRNGK